MHAGPQYRFEFLNALRPSLGHGETSRTYEFFHLFFQLLQPGEIVGFERSSNVAEYGAERLAKSGGALLICDSIQNYAECLRDIIDDLDGWKLQLGDPWRFSIQLVQAPQPGLRIALQALGYVFAHEGLVMLVEKLPSD
jgi:hypothetical protein